MASVKMCAIRSRLCQNEMFFLLTRVLLVSIYVSCVCVVLGHDYLEITVFIQLVLEKNYVRMNKVV